MSNYREISISDSDLSLKRPLEASHDPPSEKSILSQFAQKLHSAPNSCPAVAIVKPEPRIDDVDAQMGPATTVKSNNLPVKSDT